MRLSTATILIAMISGIAFLSYLGFWQLDRLKWKEALIERVEKNLSSDAVAVSIALEEAKADKELGLDYRPVKLAGEFVDTKPIFEFTTNAGKSGWNVYSLFAIEQSGNPTIKPLVVINRGFIDYDKKDEFDKSKTPSDTVEIVGLLRSSPNEQPSAAYDNEIEKRVFYWRDISAMVKYWNNHSEIETVWYVDAGLPNDKSTAGSNPKSGTTLINFPNSHLQYAFTWFGLAFALLGVGSYFLYSRRTAKGIQT